jgi:hypothetical protein
MLTHRIRRNLSIVVLAGGLLGIAVGWVHAATSEVETRPPWANSDGTVNVADLPSSLPVLDCTGAVVGTVKTPFSDKAPAYMPPVPKGADCDSVRVVVNDDPSTVTSPSP